MQASLLTQFVLPGMLALIMFGMGLNLTRADFTRLMEIPRSIILGLSGQVILLPILAFVVAKAFSLSTELAIGLMILSACPGGTTSNVISHLARANLALSVSLTAITTVICVFTTPWIIKFAINLFSDGDGTSFSLLNTSIGLVFMTLLPVLLGLYCRKRWENGALRWEKFFRRFSMIFLILIILGIVIQERDMLASYWGQVFWATLSLNIFAMVVGVVLGKIYKLPVREQLTLGIEVGVQNASMAILISITFLDNPAFAISASIYGLTMYLGSALLIWYGKVQTRKELVLQQNS